MGKEKMPLNVFTDERTIKQKNNKKASETNKKNNRFRLKVGSKQPFEVDKVRIYLTEGSYSRPVIIKPAKNSHVKCGWYQGEFYIEITGKIVARPNYLGGLTIENILEVLPAIKRETGVELSLYTLLNSRVSAVDIKYDWILPYSMQPSPFISRLREMGYQATGNRESFSFERRIGGAKVLRRVFGLGEKEKVTLQKIFDCTYDILGEAVFDIFGLESHKDVDEDEFINSTPTNLLRMLGIKYLTKKCNNNLKWIKTYFKRVCGEYCNMDYAIKKIRAYLRYKHNCPSTDEKKTLHYLLRKEFLQWQGYQ